MATLKVRSGISSKDPVRTKSPLMRRKDLQGKGDKKGAKARHLFLCRSFGGFWESRAGKRKLGIRATINSLFSRISWNLAGGRLHPSERSGPGPKRSSHFSRTRPKAWENPTGKGGGKIPEDSFKPPDLQDGTSLSLPGPLRTLPASIIQT